MHYSLALGAVLDGLSLTPDNIKYDITINTSRLITATGLPRLNPISTPNTVTFSATIAHMNGPATLPNLG